MSGDERLEQLLPHGVRNSTSGVGHGQNEPIRRLLRLQRDAAARRRVLDRVEGQIVDRLGDARGIEHGGAVATADLDREPMSRRLLSEQFGAFREKLRMSSTRVGCRRGALHGAQEIAQQVFETGDLRDDGVERLCVPARSPLQAHSRP